METLREVTKRIRKIDRYLNQTQCKQVINYAPISKTSTISPRVANNETSKVYQARKVASTNIESYTWEMRILVRITVE